MGNKNFIKHIEDIIKYTIAINIQITRQKLVKTIEIYFNALNINLTKDSILEIINHSKDIKVIKTKGNFGTEFFIVELSDKDEISFSISKKEMDILNALFSATKDLTWLDFCSFYDNYFNLKKKGNSDV